MDFYEVDVECFMCGREFSVRNIDVDVETESGYSEDDCWLSYMYRVDCPTCKRERLVDLLSNVPRDLT